jgi:hypothetical protein
MVTALAETAKDAAATKVATAPKILFIVQSSTKSAPLERCRAQFRNSLTKPLSPKTSSFATYGLAKSFLQPILAVEACF